MKRILATALFLTLSLGAQAQSALYSDVRCRASIGLLDGTTYSLTLRADRMQTQATGWLHGALEGVGEEGRLTSFAITDLRVYSETQALVQYDAILTGREGSWPVQVVHVILLLDRSGDGNILLYVMDQRGVGIWGFSVAPDNGGEITIRQWSGRARRH